MLNSVSKLFGIPIGERLPKEVENRETFTIINTSTAKASLPSRHSNKEANEEGTRRCIIVLLDEKNEFNTSGHNIIIDKPWKKNIDK